MGLKCEFPILFGATAENAWRVISCLRQCETPWSAREIASVALSAERERHTENVFYIALSPKSLSGLSLETTNG